MAATTEEKTRLVYQEDTYQFVGRGRLLSIEKDADGIRSVLIFDQTIFHPQGGGQPSDRGVICLLKERREGEKEGEKEGETEEEIKARVIFQVLDCQYDREKGQVRHYCQQGKEAPAGELQGQELEQRIDRATRELHAALHSAGHLLDTAMKKAGREDLIPSKGSHGPTGAFVEYQGNVEPPERPLLAARLQTELDALLAQHPTAATQVHLAHSLEEVARLCGPSGGAAFLPARVVVLGVDAFGCPCGGTHVKNISDLAPFRISVGKVTKKGKNVRVSYQVSRRSHP